MPRRSASSVRPLEPVKRTGLTREEAAHSLGISLTSFEEYVQPHLKLVRVGALRIVPPDELVRWVRENATRVTTREDHRAA